MSQNDVVENEELNNENSISSNIEKREDVDIKRELITMLEWFSSFCSTNRINYSIAAGTLLGAVRHKGFIPWDDDIDILLFREDYDKLRMLRKTIVDSTDYDIVCIEDNTSEFPFIKLINKKIYIEQRNIKTMNDYLWIDIFPYDVVPNNNDLRNKFYKKIKHLRIMLESSLLDTKRAKGGYKTFLKKIFHPIFRLYGAKRIAKKISKMSQKYNLTDNQYVGCVTWGYGPQDAVKKELFNDKTQLVFENIPVSAMSCWDYHLKNLYGNYMELPPIEKRITHEVKAWRA